MTIQNRVGLSPLDQRKIETVYGPECRLRDRQEKIELCQNYPGVARKKREITTDKKRETETVENKSLRVNPEITPPPTNSLTEKLNDLGIDDEVQEIVDKVYSAASAALQKVKEKHCEHDKVALRTENEVERNHTDVLVVVESIVRYAQSMVEKAESNLTVFCENSKSDIIYQRARCPFYDQSRCVQTYFKSTKSGPVKYSTNHRPVHRPSTKHQSEGKVRHYHDSWLRARDNDTEVETTTTGRRKRQATKDDLRMGTKIIIDRKGEFVPRADNKRRKRSAENIEDKVTVPVTVTETVTVKGLEGKEEKDSLRMRTMVPGEARRFSGSRQ